jgi:FtsP/CotA-like multicopper oxidase with cupredoxin domain
MLVALTLVLVPFGVAQTPHRALREVVPNDNRTAAGVLRGDTLHADFSVELATWSPEGPHSLQVKVAAIAERGGPPVIPAPLLRVRTGTVLRITVRNALADSAVRIFGLWSHPSASSDTVRLAPGAERTFTFPAGAPGTYLYGARYDYQTTKEGDNERETAMGAFVVDSLGPVPADRVFVLNIWGQQMDSATYSNALTINGLSWPLTERIEAMTGDTLRWRVVNASVRSHPMHLHGFYFTLLSKGTALADTVFAAADRLAEVTDRMRPFSTLSLEWTPARQGNWLYHCHIAYHVVPEAAQLIPPAASEHQAHSGKAGEHMRGLVLGIVVKPKPGEVAESRVNPRALRLAVEERAPHADKRRRMQYVLSEGAAAIKSTWRAGGPLLILRQGEPTDITVVNHLREATAVHWHGIELESYSDGVVGWSGADARLAPPIAPADSFVARLSLPRPGTFIYHTHLGDLDQLGAGLYGPIVVLPQNQAFDATRDHVVLSGLEGPEDLPFFRVNGDSASTAPLTLRVGEAHRLRFIDINPATDMWFMIQRDSTYADWTPLAKDGADLPLSQQRPTPARVRLAVGETRDMLFTPAAPGEWRLRVTPAQDVPGWTRRIIVRP